MAAVAVPFSANMVRAAHSVRAGSLYGTYLNGPDRTEVLELLACAQNVIILGTQKIKASFLSDTYNIILWISIEADQLFLLETDSLSKNDTFIWDHALRIVPFFGPHA